MTHCQAIPDKAHTNGPACHAWQDGAKQRGGANGVAFDTEDVAAAHLLQIAAWTCARQFDY